MNSILDDFGHYCLEATEDLDDHRSHKNAVACAENNGYANGYRQGVDDAFKALERIIEDMGPQEDDSKDDEMVLCPTIGCPGIADSKNEKSCGLCEFKTDRVNRI